jgi:hypothetical protein
MRLTTRRPQLQPSRRDSAAAPHGDPAMSMTAFFEYLHHHEATGELAQALAHAAMLRTTGARPVRVGSDQQRMAS